MVATNHYGYNDIHPMHDIFVCGSNYSTGETGTAFWVRGVNFSYCVSTSAFFLGRPVVPGPSWSWGGNQSFGRVGRVFQIYQNAPGEQMRVRVDWRWRTHQELSFIQSYNEDYNIYGLDNSTHSEWRRAGDGHELDLLPISNNYPQMGSLVVVRDGENPDAFNLPGRVVDVIREGTIGTDVAKYIIEPIKGKEVIEVSPDKVFCVAGFVVDDNGDEVTRFIPPDDAIEYVSSDLF